MTVVLKSKDYFKNWRISPDGEVYSQGRWEVPVLAAEKGTQFEIKLKPRVVDGDVEIFTVCSYTIPFKALNEESQIKLLNKYPQIFI